MVATTTITSSVNAIEPNKWISDAESFGYTKIENIENFYGPAKYIKTISDLGIDFNNTTASDDFPVYREVVIIYFKEMPTSMDEFASSYGVTPIFVKDDIKMAAFESNPRRVPVSGGVFFPIFGGIIFPTCI